MPWEEIMGFFQQDLSSRTSSARFPSDDDEVFNLFETDPCDPTRSVRAPSKRDSTLGDVAQGGTSPGTGLRPHPPVDDRRTTK